ncbi:integrase [Salinibacter ruber]|uniref:tyrosine-type recombinase/integrase n=1 Tax=Salinibacter ruber TaxID=146919 RepID=UPI002167DE78|nr:site-specific integrase [Salinibacter ruber]MCS3750579.1 integrase [Salinibacter ruber]
MASTYKRNGTYYAKFHDSSREPANKRFSLRTSKKAEARHRLTDLERAISDGDFDPWRHDPFETVFTSTSAEVTSPKSRLFTIAEVIDAFSKAKRKQGRAESTIRKYTDIWRLLKRQVGEDRDLDKLTPNQVREFIYDQSIKPATQKARYRHIRAILRWAGEGDVLSSVEQPRVGEKLPKAVRKKELDQICRAVITDYREKRRDRRCRPREIVWLVPAFRFSFFTGLRGSELGRLRWSHVNLEKRRLTIYEQKSGNQDTIPLVKPAEELLRQVGPEEGLDAFVFHSPGGDRWDRSAKRFREHVSRQFGKYRDEAGVRSGLTLHGLRHGFATRLAENGSSAVAIKRAMRHSSISTSMKYVHLANGRLQEELDGAFS